MYKINIKVSELFLIDTEDQIHFPSDDPNYMIVEYNGKVDSLEGYVKFLENSTTKLTIVVYSDNVEHMKRDFRRSTEVIKAYGGLVVNEFDEILFIFRKGFWDLPKGKKNKGEENVLAATREVEEETAATDLIVISKIGKTRHFYRTDKKDILKISHWYLMKTHKQELKPQIEEDIQQAVWMTKASFHEQKLEIYPSLVSILDNFEVDQLKRQY